jgi:peptidoglycan/xylan/chitin deacetylase (PgdA/CDA1 family)
MRALKAGTKKLIILGLAIVIIIVVVRLFLWFIYVPPILMYHSIDEHENVTKLSVSPEGFSRQMGFLYRHKYNVISLEEMVDLIKKKENLPPGTVTITFDDGYKNNFLYAYPVLKKYKFPATIFVITDFIGKEGYLTWADMNEMQENNITFGSHTKAHLWLPHLADKELWEEVFGSKEILEKNLKKEIKFISYPIGAYDERVKSVVKKAGYIAGCATNPGPKRRWDDIYALKRIRISRTSNNMFFFWNKPSGYYTFIKEIRDED